MVELLTPQVGVQARQAGQVSTAPARILAQAAGVAKGVAGQFTEFYEKEAAIQNDLLLATTQADWTQRYNETKGNAGAGYAEGMLNDYDDYVRGIMETAPQRGRDELELAHDKYRLNLETKALQREAAARAAAKAAAQAEAARLKANSLISDPTLLDDYLEGATPKETSLFVRMALSGRMKDDPQGVYDDVMGGMWDTALTPEQKISALNQSQTGLDRIAREGAAEIKVEKAAYLKRAQEEIDHVIATGGLPLDSEFDDDTIDAMFEGEPERAAELKRTRDITVQHAQYLNSVSTASPEAIAYNRKVLLEKVQEFGDTRADVARLESYDAAIAELTKAETAEEKERAAKLREEQTVYLDRVQKEMNHILATGDLPPDSEFTDKNIESMFAGEPEKVAELKRLRDKTLQQAQDISAVPTASQIDIASKLQGLQEEVLEFGDAAADVERLMSYDAAVSTRRQKIEEDAASYIHSNVDKAGEKWRLYNEVESGAKVIAAENYSATMSVMYDTMGVDPEHRNLIPKNEAEQVVASFNNMGSDVVPQVLKDFKETWGENAPQIIAELRRAGLAPEYVAAMRHSDNPGLSARIASLAGVAEKDLKENILPIIVSDATRESVEMMVDYQAAYVTGDNTGQAQKTYNQNAEIALKMTWQDVAGGADYQDALEKNFGEVFPEESINEENTQLIVPVGVDARMLRISLDATRTEEVLRAANIVALDDPRLAGFQDKEAAIESLARDGVWKNNSTGDGAVLMYNINGYLLPVTLQNGEMFQKMFSEIPARGQTQLGAFGSIWPFGAKND